MSLLQTVLLLVFNSHWPLKVNRKAFILYLHPIPHSSFYPICTSLHSFNALVCYIKTVHLHLLGGSFKCRAMTQVHCISMDTSFERNVTYMQSELFPCDGPSSDYKNKFISFQQGFATRVCK